MKTLYVQSRTREEIIDITAQIVSEINQAGWQEGAAHLYCVHTTCGLTINEGYDEDVRRDLKAFFQEIAPRDHVWRHMEGNTDAHIRSSLLGASLLIPLYAGKLCLGRWQSIYLYEGDGPRKRTILLQLLASQA